MNRLLVAVAAMSLFAFGCTAEGTEDPEPEPVAQEPQRDPPKQVRSGVFENPRRRESGSARISMTVSTSALFNTAISSSS